MLTGGFKKLIDILLGPIFGETEKANASLRNELSQSISSANKNTNNLDTNAFSYTKSLDNISMFDAFKNWFTGNIDYARQAELQQFQQSFNAEEAQKSRDFNLYTSNTAYQRQIADLEAAGLNPMVALGGSGASSGFSSAASSAAPSSSSAGAGFSKLFMNLTSLLATSLNTAVQSNNLDKRIDFMEKELDAKKQYYHDANHMRASMYAFNKDRQAKIDRYHEERMERQKISRAKELFKKLMS